ncbi:aryl-sulfate sulfotransferase [Leucobacter sp. wl10]|uniref:aryl-sulfate sulfotransferase n=1 Tax=Leucobacter sp. wl10 TaxID=2304677 RepID=UPI000E5B6A11|nr:aryl-sulfate sulfotransferase [Leucobacter sp. wl10]RGE19301.1 aryl sulfotransferase [Leucobacter sp. wl10]
MTFAAAPGRKRLEGVTYCDAERVAEGLTLIAGSWGGQSVHLVDEDGTEVHEWQLPWPPGLGQDLSPHGTLIANGKVRDQHPFLSGLPFQGGAIAEFSWSGERLWEVRYSGHHHDGILLANGNVMVLGIARVPEEIAARVRGGIGEASEPMWVDTLVELTKGGEAVWEWIGHEHLDPEIDVIGPGAMDRSEWTHGNGIVELPDGDLLVSARQISTVLRISRSTGGITHRYGAATLAGQHSPWLTDAGTLLVFDNGFNRQDGWPPYSRLVEFDLATGEEVWEYTDPVRWEMFSALQSSAQRLENGNTLACEGLTGRVFEVTGSGELVWEYVNPHLVFRAGETSGIQSNRMFRARKYPRSRFSGSGAGAAEDRE